ncbi:MAG: hypothetical protein DME34_05370 [Verrucomicrobia bacterium]|nr:MAG: hypothetical protein DME34_05370 [Verrucomicrobiota bacterium]
MKETTLILAVVCGLGLATTFAQTSSTTTTTRDAVTGTTTTEVATTSSVGTITAYTPDTDYITFRTTTDAAPVKYYYTKDTTILDPTGRTVTWSAIRPDLPATVYYVREGDRMLVRKIVLSKPTTIQKESTTTTTTERP